MKERITKTSGLDKLFGILKYIVVLDHAWWWVISENTIQYNKRDIWGLECEQCKWWTNVNNVNGEQMWTM